MSKNWYINKIKGGFAEVIARAHFECMGYEVRDAGVEKVYPYYAESKGDIPNDIKANIRNYLDVFPDFLVFSSALKSLFTVEVKFRDGNSVSTEEDLKKLEKKLLWQYRHVLFNYKFMNELIKFPEKRPEEKKGSEQNREKASLDDKSICKKEVFSKDDYYSHKKYEPYHYKNHDSYLSSQQQTCFDAYIRDLANSSKNKSKNLQEYINIPVFFYLVVIPPINAFFSRNTNNKDDKTYVYLYDPYSLKWKTPTDVEEKTSDPQKEWFKGFKDCYNDSIKEAIEEIRKMMVTKNNENK